MKVKDVMNTKIVTAYPNNTVKDLWKIIFIKKINSVPIVDARKRLLGLITREDILELLYPNFQEFVSDFSSASDFEEMEKKVLTVGKKKATDIMNKKVIFARGDTEVMRALSRMIVRHVNQLPVLSDDDRLIGVITKGDIFYALFSREKQETVSESIAGRKKR